MQYDPNGCSGSQGSRSSLDATPSSYRGRGRNHPNVTLPPGGRMENYVQNDDGSYSCDVWVGNKFITGLRGGAKGHVHIGNKYGGKDFWDD